MTYRGKSLREIRVSKGIALRSIANETRIALAYLEDLEEERFDRFPGKFYFASFAKTYACSLDLDPDQVSMHLRAAYDEWANGNGHVTEPAADAQHDGEEGILGRIAEFIRRAQEV